MLDSEYLEARSNKETDFRNQVSVRNERIVFALLRDLVMMFRKEEILPRPAATGISLAAFEEFCSIRVEEKNAIVDLALSHLERVQSSVGKST